MLIRRTTHQRHGRIVDSDCDDMTQAVKTLIDLSLVVGSAFNSVGLCGRLSNQRVIKKRSSSVRTEDVLSCELLNFIENGQQFT